MNVGFFPNLGKDNIVKTLRNAVNICESLDMTVFLPLGLDKEYPNIYKTLCIPPERVLPDEELFKSLDMAFSMGGDGTIIHLAKKLLPYDIPVCGINLGELGFLNQIELHNLHSRLQRISVGDYFLENRSMLSGYIDGPNGKTDIALAMNDIVITRTEPGKMARIILSINGLETQQYPADGFIVSTATGSSGYSLSAGGPIMAPDNHSVIVTPICPHLLQNASLVLGENATIDITMPQREKALYISVDGTFNYTFTNTESLHIYSLDKYSKFVRFHDQRFFSTLFKKLNARRELLM